MSEKYTNAEIVLVRRIEKVLSEILSDKYDCKIKIRWIPEEYGYGVIPPNHELRSVDDPIRGKTVEFVPIDPDKGDGKHESANTRTNRKLCS